MAACHSVAMTETAVRAAFAYQADWARRLSSPFTERLLAALATALDRATPVGKRMIDWSGDPVADALVLRLLGGLNALVRAGEMPALAAAYPPHPLPAHDKLVPLVTAALADDRLLPWLDHAPQTNEVARSGVLMPGLMVIAAETGLPLRLFELGASAGLNLRLDQYGYDFNAVRTGATDASVVLAPVWSGRPPPIAPVTVVARAGVDRAPIDLTRERERLLAYVWPDQTERVARLEAAIADFLADSVELERADAADWVEKTVTLAAGAVTVVLHSIAFQYFPAASQNRITAHLVGLGATATPEAPLAWLRFEFDGAADEPTLRLRLWPGGDDRLLARAHPHGASVEWFG